MSWRSSLCLHRSTDLGSQLVHFSLTTKLQQLLLFLGRKGSQSCLQTGGVRSCSSCPASAFWPSCHWATSWRKTRTRTSSSSASSSSFLSLPLPLAFLVCPSGHASHYGLDFLANHHSHHGHASHGSASATC